MTGSSGGVDVCPVDAVTEETLVETVTFVKAVSKRLGAVLAVTGAIDLVSDGQQCVVIRGGREEMSRVTGTGCQALRTCCGVPRGGAGYGSAGWKHRREYCGRSGMCGARHGGGRGGSLRDECSRRDCMGAARFMRRNASYGPVSLMLCTGWTRKCWREGFVMKCGKRDLLLYAVTDRSWSEGTTLGAQVEEALRGGATFVQLREKKADRGSTPCGGVGDPGSVPAVRRAVCD